jgi:hypothetical protein
MRYQDVTTVHFESSNGVPRCRCTHPTAGDIVSAEAVGRINIVIGMEDVNHRQTWSLVAYHCVLFDKFTQALGRCPSSRQSTHRLNRTLFIK